MRALAGKQDAFWTTPLSQFVQNGSHFFSAKFTRQERAGRPMSKGTGALSRKSHLVDAIMDLWKLATMKKTTLELPDALMQQVKLHALRRHQKLKDVIAQLLELGMAASPEVGRPRLPKPVRLKGGARLEILDMETAIGEGRDSRGARRYQRSRASHDRG
jgi:hypothetical protein